MRRRCSAKMSGMPAEHVYLIAIVAHIKRSLSVLAYALGSVHPCLLAGRHARLPPPRNVEAAMHSRIRLPAAPFRCPRCCRLATAVCTTKPLSSQAAHSFSLHCPPTGVAARP